MRPAIPRSLPSWRGCCGKGRPGLRFAESMNRKHRSRIIEAFLSGSDLGSMLRSPVMRKLSVFVLILGAYQLPGQETPTEREAAHEVLHKMAALEKSLDIPGTVARLTGANP